MIMTEHGKVQGGGIVFEKPLTLPAGTEVVVRIEPLVGEQPSEAPPGPTEFTSVDLTICSSTQGETTHS